VQITLNMNRVMRNQLDAQLILSIFRRPLHVLGVVCCPSWMNNSTGTTDSHLKRIISINCCIHTVVPPDDGPRYARNMEADEIY
jgi:hypothetical protein